MSALKLKNEERYIAIKATKIAINIYLASCIDMYRCFKNLNKELRAKEGVNISSYTPFLLEIPKTINIDEDQVEIILPDFDNPGTPIPPEIDED